MDKKINQLVDLIQKMAQEHPPVWNPTSTTPTTPHGPSSTIHKPSGGVSNPGIQQMQVAIEELAAKLNSSSMPVNMPNNLISELAKISHPIKGQRFSDGSWGPTTDAALHHVVDLAKYLSVLSDKFKINIEHIFPKEAINLFGTLLTGYTVGPHNISLKLDGDDGQIKRAHYITQRIEATSELYTYILSKISAVTNNSQKLLNHDERRLLQHGSVIVNLNDQPRVVPLSVLVSPTKYNEWIKLHQLENDKIKILDLIIEKRNAVEAL